MTVASIDTARAEIPVIDLRRARLKPVCRQWADWLVHAGRGRYLRLDGEQLLQVYIHPPPSWQRRRRSQRIPVFNRLKWRRMAHQSINRLTCWASTDAFWVSLSATLMIGGLSLIYSVFSGTPELLYRAERDRQAENADREQPRPLDAKTAGAKAQPIVDRPPVGVGNHNTDPNSTLAWVETSEGQGGLGQSMTVDDGLTSGDAEDPPQLAYLETLSQTIDAERRTLTDLEIFDLLAIDADVALPQDVRDAAHFKLQEFVQAHRIPPACVAAFSLECQTILSHSFAGGAPRACEVDGYSDACEAALARYWVLDDSEAGT